MKPQKSGTQKQSIRDFFSPAPRSQQGSLGATPKSSSTAQSITTPVQASGQAPDTPPSTIPKGSRSKTASASALPSRTAPLSAANPSSSQPVKLEAQPPPPSQDSAASGTSKRTVSNGEAVVLNSDSDSDSLPDLDWGAFTSASVKPLASTRVKRAVDDDGDELRKPQKKGRNRKFDKLAETAQQNIGLEQKILDHKADLAKLTEEEANVTATVIDERTLAQAVDSNDDPETARRLFLAMQRTNAAQTDHVYHFFADASDVKSVNQKFPRRSLPKSKWAMCFQEQSSRDQAFITGFARQIFRMQELPEEVALWMIEQICISDNNLLSLKYMEILDLHHDYYGELLSQERFEAIVTDLGGLIQDMKEGGEIVRSFDVLANTPPALPPSLRSVAKLLKRAAPWLRFKSKGNILHVLFYICMDDRVATDPNVLQPIQEAIEAILCNFADREHMSKGLNEVVPELLAHITDPVLQRALVCVLPTQSPLTADFQRNLALSFLIHPKTFHGTLSDPQLPTLLHTHLDQSPHFQVNRKTDYGALAARLVLLDIAIGPGLLTVPHQPLLSPPESQDPSPLALPPVPSASEIKIFNAEVDTLAQHIKIVGNSVVEASASVDLTILEAKDCVERLCARLEHAVRIGGRKTQNLFGANDDGGQLKVSEIFRKVARTRERAENSVFADEGDDEDEANAQIQAELRASQ